jgi:hypothetical protein
VSFCYPNVFTSPSRQTVSTVTCPFCLRQGVRGWHHFTCHCSRCFAAFWNCTWSKANTEIEDRSLTRFCGPRGSRKQDCGVNYVIERFEILTLHQILWFNSLHLFPVCVMNYIFKYKQAVFAHYLSDVIPLFLFYI